MRVRTCSTFHGTPCVKCGGTKRYLRNNDCAGCHNAWALRYYRVHREAINQRRREQGKGLEYRYGITKADYDMMFVEQNGRCYICQELTDKTLHVDHCHTTGRVRRLLCGGCNRGLGCFRDAPESLRRAADYLQETT